ncbi:DUF6790 family protein [Thermopirellula anaerolimosa]
MIFIIIFLVTVVGAGAHLYIFQSVPRTKERIVEVFLLYFLCVEWGFGAVVTSIPHILIPDRIANYIGWQTGSPFQIELGFASLGIAILGILSIWLRGWFWVAPAISHSVFLFGAAFVHIREIIGRGNFNPGNAGPILFFDIAVPLLVLGLLLAHIRMGGMAKEKL